MLQSEEVSLDPLALEISFEGTPSENGLPENKPSVLKTKEKKETWWAQNKYYVISAIVLGTAAVAIICLVIFVAQPEEEEKGKQAAKSNETERTGKVNIQDEVEDFDLTEKEYQTWCLEEHNRYRKMHAASEIKLNKKMTKQSFQCAHYYLELGQIDHSCPHKHMHGNCDAGDCEKYGENLYMMKKAKKTLSEMDFTKRAMDGWYKEVEDYDFESGKSKNGKQVGHFTQLVWQEMFEMGVAFMRTDTEAVVVCLYNPHGNVRGDYSDNVKPKTE